MIRSSDIACPSLWVIGGSAAADDLRGYLRAAGVEVAGSEPDGWLLVADDAAGAHAWVRGETGAPPVRGRVVIDATAGSATEARERARVLADRGAVCVDLACIPAAWSPSRATHAGVAAVVYAGEVSACERAQPWLQALARGCVAPAEGAVPLVRAGETGASRIALDAHRIIVAGTAQAVAEAMVLTRALQADTDRVAAAMAGGFAASEALARFGRPGGSASMPAEAGIASGGTIPAWSIALGAILGEAHAQGSALPLTALVAQQVNALAGAGRESSGLAALGWVLERMRAREDRA